MRDHSQSAFGRHVYDPADFGLSDQGIDDRYGAYVQRFQIPRE